MLIDAYASQRHYADHLVPIFEALPGELRGEVWAGNGSAWWGDRLPARYRPVDRVVLVAGFSDAVRLSHVPTVYVEHGAGQTYQAVRHGAYPGGKHPPSVVGYLAPSERVAAAWHRARPGVPVGIVGCPKLDRWLAGRDGFRAHERPRTVAVSWHWNCEVAPEARSALGHYRAQLRALCEAWRTEGWQVLGHGHPRAWGALEALWRSLGVEPVPEWDAVVDRAGLLVVDNSSAMYEWAALDRPVVALNAPWYRRDVHHGLRFWSDVPGLQVDGPDELAALDLARYVDDDPSAQLRRDVAVRVYAHRDGTSARRAAAWLQDLLQEGIAWPAA